MTQLQLGNPAETYEHYFVPAMFLPWTTVLLRHAAVSPQERVLDVACGTGIVARQAAPLVGIDGQVVGLDVNPQMLAVARGIPGPEGAAIDWQEGNALALPFSDGVFDVVLCQHGLQFFPDRAGALGEMCRVLEDGGRALSIVLQTLARHPVFEALVESVASHLNLPIQLVMTPFSLCDPDELRALFVVAGFKNVTIVQESTTVRFPEAERFVPLATMSSAAAVPAFAQLTAPEKAALLEAVRDEVGPTIEKYRDGNSIVFPMFAHVAMGSA